MSLSLEYNVLPHNISAKLSSCQYSVRNCMSESLKARFVRASLQLSGLFCRFSLCDKMNNIAMEIYKFLKKVFCYTSSMSIKLWCTSAISRVADPPAFCGRLPHFELPSRRFPHCDKSPHFPLHTKLKTQNIKLSKKSTICYNPMLKSQENVDHFS